VCVKYIVIDAGVLYTTCVLFPSLKHLSFYKQQQDVTKILMTIVLCATAGKQHIRH